MIMVLVTVMSVVMVVVTMTTLMVMVVVLVVEKCKDSIDSIVFTPTDNHAINMYGLL